MKELSKKQTSFSKLIELFMKYPCYISSKLILLVLKLKVMSEIGNKIRQLRELKGFTQDYMAGKMGVSQRAYSKIENNETKMNWEKLTKVSEILEVSPSDITSFDDNIIFNNCKQEQAGKNLTINKVPELLIQQFQERIAHLEKEIEFLRKQLE